MIVVLRKSASREIADLPDEYYSKIKKRILSLGDDPYPHLSLKMHLGHYLEIEILDKKEKNC